MYVAVAIFGELYNTQKQKENNRNIIDNVNAGGSDGDVERLQNVFCTISGAPIVIEFVLDVVVEVMDEFGNMRSSIKTLGNDLIIDSSEFNDIISMNTSESI